MSFRSFVERMAAAGGLKVVRKPVSKKLEAAAVLKALDGAPVLLEKVGDSAFAVAGNVFSTKKLVADYFGVSPRDLTPLMIKAIESPSEPTIVGKGACQEVVEDSVDLDKLPILFHCEQDGGPYVSAGVVVARDDEMGLNVSFHRCMQISKNKFAIRILERHLDSFIKRNGGELDVAMSIGNAPNVLLAGATSVEAGFNEFTIANSLEPLELVRAKTVDVLVPAECEFVLEGRITSEVHDEGPFVDLTETYDVVRKQRVFEVKKITHRRNAVYHALLPGQLEHKLLMGMPREPTIFKEVNKVCKCVDVSITPGGCSWLHAVIAIDKKNEEDGKKAIEAAFKGHPSLKLATIVDSDINVLDPLEVEWAIATRFQAKNGLVIKLNEKGSSLDPSADPLTRETSKMGVDATKPLVVKGKNFVKAEYRKISVAEYLE